LVDVTGTRCCRRLKENTALAKKKPVITVELSSAPAGISTQAMQCVVILVT
jgi:hypothetical protein